MELKTARRIARLSQRELAERSGASNSTISLLENEKRAYGTVAYQDIVRIARALNVDPEELFPVSDLATVGADDTTPDSAAERRRSERRAS